jgi:glycosyltransferase involved in cell wall biosynthesis
MKLSVVTPAFNEADGITSFLESLRNVLDGIGVAYEVIVVNDGSTDETLSKLLVIKWDELHIIDLVANAGHMAALEAGLRASTGDLVLTMDSDGQHPVELIPGMISRLHESACDVVVGVRIRGKEDTFFRRTASTFFYKILGLVSNIEIEQNAADFRLITRLTLDILLTSPEKTKVFRFLISDYGYKVEKFSFSAHEREFGESKYHFSSLLRLAMQSIIGFSTAPLTAISVGGVLFLFFSFVYAGFLFISYLVGNSTPGWTSIMLFLTLFSALQFLALGIIGRYLIEVLHELRKRPTFIVRRVYGNRDRM